MAIDTVNPVFKNRYDEWAQYEALDGGTKTMREAGKTYLPQEPKEADQAYLNRLRRTTLFNGFKRTLRTLCSRPFLRPVQAEDTTEEEQAFENNIDRRGQSLSDFAKAWLLQALKKNYGVVIVDHPQVDGEPDRAQTVAQDLRGYPVILQNEDLIDYKIEQVEGRDELTEFRYFETVEKENPEDQWTNELVKQIKVWRRDEILIYRAPTDAGESVVAVADWTLHDSFPNTLGKIPVVTLYQNKEATFDSDNNLNDLSFLNINHWQNSSDQQNILHVARVPILFYKGWNKDDEFQIGPNTMATAISTEADLKYVEHSGAAIDAGSSEIHKIEDRMAIMGADMLVRRTASKTATEKMLNEEAETSELGQMVVSLETNLSRVYQLIAEWNQGESNATFDIYKDFAINVDDGDLQILLQSRLAGEITRETYLQELKRRGVLSDGVDVEAEAETADLDTPDE